MAFEWVVCVSRHSHSDGIRILEPKPYPNLSGDSPNVNVARGKFRDETDPMRTVWDALANHGCQPHGDPHSFRAKCPAHEGTNPDALRVYEGVNRQAVLGCYAHSCDWRAITDALGLPPSALFPAGHKNGPRTKPAKPVEPRPLNAGAAFLDLLAVAGFEWKAHLLGTRCPYCDNPHAYLTVHGPGGLDVNCPDGCTEAEVRRAVETRAAIAEKGLTL